MDGNIPFSTSEMQIISSNCSCVSLLIHPPIYVDLFGTNEPGSLIPLQIQKLIRLQVAWERFDLTKQASFHHTE